MLNDNEKKIIEYGIQNGKTRQESLDALNAYRNRAKVPIQPKEPIGPTFKERFVEGARDNFENIDRFQEEVAQGKRNSVNAGFHSGFELLGAAGGLIKESVGTAISAYMKAVGSIPDTGIGGEGTFGETLKKRFVEPVVKPTITAIGNMPDTAIGGEGTLKETLNKRLIESVAQTVAKIKEENPEGYQYARDAGMFVTTVLEAWLAKSLIKGAVNTTRAAGAEVVKNANMVKNAVGTVYKGTAPLATKTGEVIRTAVTKAVPPEEIMNRVARLSPKQAQKFEKLAGESHGKYLQRTGNMGKPEEIIANEAKKFTNSLKEVDDALATLPGKYKSPHINSILKDMVAREKAIGVANAETARIRELARINKAGGLSMKEINEAKRIYERTVKLGYQTERNAIGIERSTRLDSAVREWQFANAPKLGLQNLPELNRQTQMSKFLINELGKNIVGGTGNNAITLTDWIILSGGDPTAIAAFFGKKLLSMKGIQAELAKLLTTKPPEGPIKAILTPSQTTPPLPSGGLPPNKLGISSTPKIPPKTKPVKPPNLGQGETLKLSKSPSALSKEAVKYKTAEEAMNSPEMIAKWEKINKMKGNARVTKTSNNLYHTTSAENIESIRKNGLTIGNKARNEGVSSPNKISFSANEAGAKYYGNNGDIMIRTKTSYKPNDLELDLLAGGKGTYTTGKNIPPEMLEVKINGKWQDLTKSQLTLIWEKANKK